MNKEFNDDIYNANADEDGFEFFTVYFHDGCYLSGLIHKAIDKYNLLLSYGDSHHSKSDVFNNLSAEDITRKQVIHYFEKFMKKERISYSFEDIDVDYGIVDDMDIVLAILD